MPKTTDATERRLNLVIALLGTRRGLSKAYLRENVNGYTRTAATASAEATAAVSFERMFERDKETLRELGIPLTTTVSYDAEVQEQALYRIDPAEYRVPLIRLDEQAMNLVAVAAGLWAEAAFGPAAQSAVRKIAARSETSWYDDDTTVQARIRTQEPAFEPLWEALRQGHAVSFDYQGAADAAPRARRVQPWGLGNKYGQWYLASLDLDSGQERSFRLSRISSAVNIQRTDRAVTPPDFSITAFLDRLGQQDATTGLVRVPTDAAHALRRRPGTTVHSSAPGTDVLAITYREPALMADDLAALGASAHVLAPEPLRTAVLARLRAAADAMAQPSETARLRPAVDASGPKKDTRERLVRLLSMVPFLVANPGIAQEDLAQEFGLSLSQLRKDLDTLTVSGLPGYLHGDLMDVSYDAGQVFIRDAETLASPLRLSQAEACALLVGLDTLTALPGTREAQALQRAVTAVRQVAGPDAWLADVVALQLLSGTELETITRLQALISSGTAAEIGYLVRSRDELTVRVIEPRRIYSIDSQWYVRAWCHRAQALRSFRIDGITSLHTAGPQEHFPAVAADEPEPAAAYTPGAGDTEVLLFAEPDTARRLAPAYGAQVFSDDSSPWLALRLLVGASGTVPPLMARLGGRARVVEPAALRTETARWLERALASYATPPHDHAVGETTTGAPGGSD